MCENVSAEGASEKAGEEDSATDDRGRRQLSLRTRKRVPRPVIITPSPLRALDELEGEDEETAFTLSRGAGDYIFAKSTIIRCKIKNLIFYSFFRK